ncbi:hypothetical protein ABK905_11370 [Acerihabitans sp. KWT182]|uniref:Mandelate racemase/muconate lactonizing enzyme N-terminal domain-containing protein n=1 Tax=Acerihabitans sp. KWT182 TaxID=3157919 RepID=A0AAU7QEW9_9GAMM
MKIAAMEVYGYDLTYAHGQYVMSQGRAAVRQASTLVRIITDEGLEGWGESSTLGGLTCPPSPRAPVRASVSWRLR